MILPILQYGDPILASKGKRIEEIDDRIRDLAASMIETMHAAHGIGLAAQQIGEALQLTVLDISAVEDRPSTLKLNGKDTTDPKTVMPLVLINPEIELRGETEVGLEGCLSFPEITGDIERAHSIMVRAQTLEGDHPSRSERILRARFSMRATISMEFYLSIECVRRQRPRCRVA